MADFGTIVFSVSTTLALQAAYFGLWHYPDVFTEKVGAMALFSRKYSAELSESEIILATAKAAADTFTRARDFYLGSASVDDSHAALINEVQTARAKFRAYRDSGTVSDFFVSVYEEKLRNLDESLGDSKIKGAIAARSIYFDIVTLDSASKVHQQRAAERNAAYLAEMITRQAAVTMLGQNLRIAMVGVQVYLTGIAVWCGDIARAHGASFKAALVLVMILSLGAVMALEVIANRTIKPARHHLDEIRKLSLKS